jgi:hypothetical protein
MVEEGGDARVARAPVGRTADDVRAVRPELVVGTTQSSSPCPNNAGGSVSSRCVAGFALSVRPTQSASEVS